MEKLKTQARVLFVERTNRTFIQFFRYGLVAVVALAFDFGTYATLVRGFAVHPVVAATFGFSLGLLVNYLLSIVWVFKERTRSKRVEIVTFFGVGLIGLGLTDLIIWILAIDWDWDELVSKLVAAVLVFFWNFGARKVLLFKAGDERAEPQNSQQ